MNRLRPALLLAPLALAAMPAFASAAPTAPTLTAPAAVTAASSVNVQWSAATFDALATGARYTVKVSTVNGALETPLPGIDVAAPTLQTTLVGLANGTTYRVRVVASELPCLDDPLGATCATQAADPAGRVAGPASDAVEFRVDQTNPVASLSLDGGAAWTTENDVTAGLTATDASGLRMVLGTSQAQVACGNPATCGVPFSPATTVTLPDPDGPKTVFARVVDAAGNSTVVSDGINLDSTAPDLWATADDLTVTTDDTVSFSTKSATDSGSGLVETSFAWTFCGGCATGATGRTATRRFTTPGSYEVTLRARDVAGNVGVDSFFVTVTPPDSATPPAAAAGPGTPPGAAATGSIGPRKTLKAASVYGVAKVGTRLRVRVILARRAKVTIQVLTLPSQGRTLLKSFRSRTAFRKGATIFRLPAPTLAATRLFVVTAGGETTTFRARILP